MAVTQLTTAQELQDYNLWLHSQPDGNFWQSFERKKYSESLGREARIYVLKETEQITTAALVMIDRTAFGFSTWDIPRGPVGKDREELLQEIIKKARTEKAVSVYYSPFHSLENAPRTKSPRHIHCEATRIIDLTKSEEEILAQMKQKGRYNIGVAQKHGITIERSKDIKAFYELVRQTSKRDGFISLREEKYQAFLEHIPNTFLWLAYDTQKKPIAGLIGVIWGKNAIYYYGASSYADRASMAPYLLQWEAMKYCRSQGCKKYDLLGISPPSADVSDSWQGISVFKEKFGGNIVEFPAEKVVVLKPFILSLLSIKRKLIG